MPSNFKNRKGSPPNLNQSSLNLSKKPSGDSDTIFFRVPAEFRREVKVFAAEHDMSLAEIFIRAFEKFKVDHK